MSWLFVCRPAEAGTKARPGMPLLLDAPHSLALLMPTPTCTLLHSRQAAARVVHCHVSLHFRGTRMAALVSSCPGAALPLSAAPLEHWLTAHPLPPMRARRSEATCCHCREWKKMVAPISPCIVTHTWRRGQAGYGARSEAAAPCGIMPHHAVQQVQQPAQVHEPSSTWATACLGVGLHRSLDGVSNWVQHSLHVAARAVHECSTWLLCRVGASQNRQRAWLLLSRHHSRQPFHLTPLYGCSGSKFSVLRLWGVGRSG